MGSLKKNIRLFRKMRATLGLPTTLSYIRSAITGKDRFSVRINGVDTTLRIGSPDLKVALETLGGEFEALRDVVRPDFDGLVIDAGGYIGTAALKFASIFTKAQILTIEPSPENFAMLKHNVAAHPRIFAKQAALAPVAGETIKLLDRGTGQWGLTIVQAPRDREGAPVLTDVRTTSLEEIAHEFPDLELGVLKLDIEGAEKALFDTSPEILREVPVIVAELHDKIVEGCKASFAVISEGRTNIRLGHEKHMTIHRPNHLEPKLYNGPKSAAPD